MLKVKLHFRACQHKNYSLVGCVGIAKAKKWRYADDRTDANQKRLQPAQLANVGTPVFVLAAPMQAS